MFLLLVLVFIFVTQASTSLSVKPYYYDPSIHSLGNTGIGGKIHANLAYASTKIIDRFRYSGRDIRKEIYQPYLDAEKSILDMCCGIGMSTPPGQIGIDTSVEMLKVARRRNDISTDENATEFYWGNAETYRINKPIDVVTCMFAFHEMPNYAHIKVIQNALMIAKEEFVIVDIAPNYKQRKPPEIMLKGEPYLLNYLDSINEILYDFEETVYIPDHVHIWRYKK